MHTRSSTCHIHRSYKHAFLCFPPDSHTYPQPAAWMTCSSWATATCSSSRRKKPQIRTMCQLWVFIDEELRTPAVSQQSPFQQEETSDRARLREGQPVTSSLLGPHTVGLVMHLCDLPLSTQRQPGSSLWAPPGWTWNMAPRKHLAAQSSSCRVRRFVIQWPHTCLSHRLTEVNGTPPSLWLVPSLLVSTTQAQSLHPARHHCMCSSSPHPSVWDTSDDRIRRTIIDLKRQQDALHSNVSISCRFWVESEPLCTAYLTLSAPHYNITHIVFS